MATVIDLERMVVQISADLKRYENAMNRAQGITNRTARNIETRFQRMNRLASGTLGSFGRGIGGALVAGFSAREAGQLLDAATRIQNALKVTGLEGENLTKVYNELLKSAQRNAAPFEDLVTLYSRVSQSSKELGASQQDILKFTDNVALALRASGKSAQEASGALLQLSQALGGGVVRAEEFNSILEGAPTIIQAVAAGIQEAGGSVAKLRQLVLDGSVSSEAFFRGLEAGAPILEKKVAGAVLTISQRMTNLQTALIDAAKEFNESTAVAETFGSEIDRVAQFVASVDFNNLISQIRAVAAEFNLGIEAARGFFSEIGRLTGLENIGKMITGGAAFTEHIPGLRVTSQAGLDDLFDRNAGLFQELSEEERKKAEALKDAAASLESVAEKGDRLGATGVKPISLEDHAVKAATDKVASTISSALIKTAEQFAGFNENRPNDRAALSDFFKSANQNVDPKMTAWCAAFVNAVLATNGLPGTGALNARSFLDYGRPTQDPKPGDLVVLRRGSGNVQGHVGFFMGNAEGGGVRVLGGNQGNEVSTKTFSRDDVLGFRQVPGAQDEGLARAVTLRQQQLEIVRQTMTAIQQQTEMIGLETSLIGASNAERERQTLIMETLNQLQSQGITITDELRAQVEQEAAARYGQVAAYDAAALAADNLRARQEELKYVQEQVAGAFQGALKGLISDLINGKDATEALLDAVSRLADRLLDIALDQLFASLFGGGIGGIGGAGGGLLAGLFHQGGKAGAATASRTVSPLLFAGARRYHSGGLAGLKPGEVPAILQRGELVIPRSKVRDASRSAAASPNVDARTTVINRFDAAGVLSEALSQPEGVKVVLNVIRSQPGAFRSAING